MFFADTMAEVGKFMDSGGMVLWAIVVLLFVMWTLIFERAWYLRSSVVLDVQGALDVWEQRSERKSKHAHQIREKLISEVSIKIDENIMMIKTLVALAPLFGLLGTVTGMIVVFDVMAFTGGGDAKAMASHDRLSSLRLVLCFSMLTRTAIYTTQRLRAGWSSTRSQRFDTCYVAFLLVILAPNFVLSSHIVLSSHVSHDVYSL